MKRIGNLYDRIISVENLILADRVARRGKRNTHGVRIHDKNPEDNIRRLHSMLKEGTYKTSEYHVFKITCPKEREIYRLPYYPDRIVHHAVMNVLEPIWINIFNSDTYSCIKGRGIHGAARKIKQHLKDVENTRYCLKLDIRKFYPSIKHDILKSILRKKIKDDRLLTLLDEIIDSAPGVPIGNYLSQYFANLYLAYFDHWMKESLRVKYYYRYADDIVILDSSKEKLHCLLAAIGNYLAIELDLEIKSNYQIFPVESRGIDFVGYRFYHTHTLLRKSIKKRFARAVMRKGSSIQTHAAYWGWAKHANCINLLSKLKMKEFKDFNIAAPVGGFSGEKIKIAKVMNKPIVVNDYKLEPSKFEKNKTGQCLTLSITVEDEKRVLFTGSDYLIRQIEHVDRSNIPFRTTITKEGEHYQFN